MSRGDTYGALRGCNEFYDGETGKLVRRHGYGTQVADVSVAFLRADEAEENVFMKVPDEFYDYAKIHRGTRCHTACLYRTFRFRRMLFSEASPPLGVPDEGQKTPQNTGFSSKIGVLPCPQMGGCTRGFAPRKIQGFCKHWRFRGVFGKIPLRLSVFGAPVQSGKPPRLWSETAFRKPEKSAVRPDTSAVWRVRRSGRNRQTRLESGPTPLPRAKKRRFSAGYQCCFVFFGAKMRAH